MMKTSMNHMSKTPWRPPVCVLLIPLTLLLLGAADGDTARPEEDCAGHGLRIRELVANGKLTAEEGRKEYKVLCGDRNDGRRRRIAIALSEAGIERNKIRDVMGTLRRIMEELRTEGDAFELDPNSQAHLEGLGLTPEQINSVVGLSRRIAAARVNSKNERDDGIRRRIAVALSEAGIEREKIRAVMGTLRSITGEVLSEGDAFQLDPEIRKNLESMNLTNDQIDYVVTLAQRLASRRTDEGETK